MLGMSVCYLILGGCFYNIEDIVERKKAESTPVEIKDILAKCLPLGPTTYPYAIKNQRKARNAPSRGHFVPKPLGFGGFGCLELVLYGIRELA